MLSTKDTLRTNCCSSIRHVRTTKRYYNTYENGFNNIFQKNAEYVMKTCVNSNYYLIYFVNLTICLSTYLSTYTNDGRIMLCLLYIFVFFCCSNNVTLSSTCVLVISFDVITMLLQYLYIFDESVCRCPKTLRGIGGETNDTKNGSNN